MLYEIVLKSCLSVSLASLSVLLSASVQEGQRRRDMTMHVQLKIALHSSKAFV